MDMNQYLDIFIEESKEHLQTVSDKLLDFEKNPTDIAIVQEIFRSAHTLKGMSSTMGYEDLAHLTHEMENVLDAVRNGVLEVTTTMMDVLFQSVESLEEMVFSIASGGDGKKDVNEVTKKLSNIINGEEVNLETAATVTENSTLEYQIYELEVMKKSISEGFSCFEITISLREDCILKAVRVYMVLEKLEQLGEVIKTNPTVELLEEGNFDHSFTVVLLTKSSEELAEQTIVQVSEIENVKVQKLDVEAIEKGNIEKEFEKVTPTIEEKKEDSTDDSKSKETTQTVVQNNSKTIRVNIDRLDVLMNLFEELVIDRGRLEQISLDVNQADLTETVERMSRITSDLQGIILKMRMVQVDTVFNRFPRMVRQLTKDLGKKINFEIVGAETELDRTVIDEIGDPLVHLIRNGVDHGIEMPEERLAKGKKETGTLLLKAYHSGNHVFIEIQDDGHGLSQQRLIEKAIKKGMITPEHAKNMTEQEIYGLIFSSGFSTATTISDISGRGVGLDVVRNTISSLGGSISIESTEGIGTTFLIQLPLTLSIISVMLVEIGDQKYAIPLSSIMETALIKKEEILKVHHQRVVDFRGKIIPIVDLRDVFESNQKNEVDTYSVVVVKKGEKYAGFIVDSLIGQYEIVLKSLGNYLTNVFAISGATILGDGQVALIIDSNALIK